jgi:hypothetical protein
MHASVPWQVFTSPVQKWAVQPSFVVGEWMFVLFAAIALWHATRCGRAHVLVWVGALVAGTANDLIFMALPLVDNFWQAQATIMLTARLPLYIPCVYICFMYVPTVAVWRLGLPPLAGAAATGLLAAVFYGPYDIVGADFLWWTWHDTDRAIEHRLLGAPIGSTMWVITFVAAFSYPLRRVIDRGPVDGRRFAVGLALVAGLSSLVMVAQITLLQQLDGGVPGVRGLVVVVVAYALVVAHRWRSRVAAVRAASDRVLFGAVAAYFLVLVAIMAVFDPATHRSTSVHQTYGRCHVEAKDITGHTRFEFLCAQDFDEDFTFDCVDELPRDGDQWYTVCGRAHDRLAQRLLAISGLAALGIALFLSLLVAPARARATYR